MANLVSQFFLRESDVGSNRATATYQRATELNSYVAMSAETGPLTEDMIVEHTVVLLTKSNLKEQKRINEITHRNNITFIVADVRGLYAQVFNNFGPKFTCVDTTGSSLSPP